MINKTTLVGRLGKAPEVRYTGEGTPVANLAVATTETWKDKAGERQERTEWHKVVVFGSLADVAAKHLDKGALVFIEGKNQTRKWSDTDGKDVYTTEVVVDRSGVLRMLERKAENAAPPNPTPNPTPDSVPFNDEIPF